MKINRHPSAASSLYLVLLLLLALGPASGKKTILKQLSGLMTDSGGNGSVVDDAATGTVQNVAGKQAASCDGQLATALVQANDLAAAARKEKDEASLQHGRALAKIAGLEQDLVHTKNYLEKDIAELTEVKNNMDQIIQGEKDLFTKELEETKTKAQEEYEALRDEKDASLKALEEESTKKLQSAKKEYQTLNEEKDQVVLSLEAKLRMSSEELETTMRAELERAKLDKETAVAALTADRDDIVAKLEEIIDTAAREAAKILQKTQEEAAATIASLQADRDAKVAAVTQEMESNSQKAAEVLQRTKDEAKAFLKQQLEAKNLESEQVKRLNEEQHSEKNGKIQKMQEYTEQMLKKKAAIERSLEESKVEITHWKDLHAHRSYCNMTHVTTDLYDAGLIARDAASAHISKGLENSKRFVHEQFNELWLIIEPHYQKQWLIIEPYYQEHVANNYQTHLEPHVQKHVVPRLDQASVWFRATAVPFVKEVVEEIIKMYKVKVTPVVEEKQKEIVNMYGYYCKLYLREFQKATKESDILKDYPPPAYVLESWKTSCANPQESLGALLNGIFTLLALIFYRRIFGLVWWIGTFSLSLVLLPLRLTPLGWFLPRRSTGSKMPKNAKKSSESPPAVKKVGGASPAKKKTAKLY